MSEASVFETERDTYPTEHPLKTFDIKVLCDIASKGNTERVCSMILSNTQEDSSKSKTENALIYAEALYDFLFCCYLSIKQQTYLPISNRTCERLDKLDKNDKVNDKIFEERYNCILTNQHIVQEYPNLILRSLLLLPPWFEIPWNAAEATLEVLHSNRLTNKNTIIFIAELKNFLTSTMIHINDQFIIHADCNHKSSSSYSSHMEKNLSSMRRILGRLFSLTYIVISPFFLSHKRNFYDVRDYLHNEELYDHLYKYILKQGQLNKPGKSWNTQRGNQHLIMPLDLLPSLFHSMICIEKKYEKMMNFMSKSIKQSTKTQNKASYNVIISFLFPPSDVMYDKSHIEKGHILLNHDTNINPTLLPSLMTVASDCATFLSSRNWVSLYYTISNNLHIRKKSSEGTHNEKSEKIHSMESMIAVSDYASLIRQCIVMMLVVTRDITMNINQVSKDIPGAYENKTLSCDKNTEFKDCNAGCNDTAIDSSISNCSFRLKWERLIFKIYFGAAVCGVKGTLETVDTVLRSVLAQSTPPKVITSLIEYAEYASNPKTNKYRCMNQNLYRVDSNVVINTDDEIPTWVFANILLLIFRSQKSPRKVFRLTATLMGIHENIADHVSRILTLLVNLTVSNSNADFNLAQCHRKFSRCTSFEKAFFTPQNVKELKLNSLEVIDFLDLFRVVCYTGKRSCEINIGSTCGMNSENTKWTSSVLNALCNLATSCTTLVYESLFQGGDANDDSCSISSEVGFAWTQAAYHMMSQNGTDIRMSTSIFAIFTVVCVYCNVAASRQSIIRNILLGLTNETTGYNSLEKIKYCTLCHILVSSIVRNHRPQFSDAFDNIGKERESFECCGSELTPISDLLASSSTVNLSPLISKRLLHAFLPLPSARGNILTMCQKFLSPKLIGQSFESEKNDNLPRKKVLKRNLALEGLCGLILVNDDKKNVYDKVGEDALKILREIIVLKKPNIPSSAQIFLFQMLVNMSTQKTHNSWTLSSWTILLLFRSCLSALLCYFITEQASNEEDLLILIMKFINNGDECSLRLREKIQSAVRFVPFRCVLTMTNESTTNKHDFILRDDVLNLIKLTFTLYNRQLKNRKSSRIDDGGLSPYQKLILCLSESVCAQNIEQSYDAKFLTNISSAPEVYVLDVICLTCISQILDFTLNGETTQQKSQKSSRSKECTSLQEFLLIDEFKELMKSNIYGNNEHLMDRMKSLSFINPDAFLMLRSSLSKIFQLVISIERNKTDQFEHNNSKDWERLCNLFLILNYRTPDHNIPQTVKSGLSLHLNNEFSCEEFILATSFISALSNTVFKSNFDYINSTKLRIDCDLFETIIQHCDVIAKGIFFMNNEQGVKSSDMLVSNVSIFSMDSINAYVKLTIRIWKVYLALCCEENLKRLIHVIQNGDNHADSNSEIYGERDLLDTKIQSLRFYILKAMQSSMLLHLNKLSTLHQSLHGLLRHDDLYVAIEHDVCFEMVDKIAKDLSLGLEGHSGSISPDLYMMFLKTIQEVINIISFSLKEICSKVGFKNINNYSSICERTSLVLWCILCRYSLKQALLIKSTLKLSLSTLPLLSQRMLRRANVGENEMLLMNMNAMAVDALIQCLDVLKKWYVLNSSRNTKYSWNEVFSNQKNSDTEIPDQGTRFTHKIKMISPDVWTWTMDSALLAIDLNWNESSSIIQQKNGNQNIPQLLCENYITQFCVTRMKDLAATLKVLVGVLDHVNSVDTEKREKSVMDEVDHTLETPLCAELLTEQCKVRLCRCLDRIFVTMKNASLCTIKSLQETHPSKKFTSSLLESIICLATLFQNSIVCVDNIASGTRLWTNKEKKKALFRNTESHERENHNDKNRVLSRLSSTLFRIKAFEIAVQNLLDEVSRLENFFLGEYDVLFCMIMEKEPEEGIMHSLLTEYINAYSSTESRRMTLNQDVDKLAWKNGLDYNYRSPTQNERFSTQLSLKRKRSNRNLHDAHRQILRSRNQVVDEWLELDKDLSTDEEEFGDAFVDLEDFLEDG